MYNCMEQQLFTIVLEQQKYEKYIIRIAKRESPQSRVVCYCNMGDVKKGKLKYSMKERIRKTMQLNREIKQGELNIRKKNLKILIK